MKKYILIVLSIVFISLNSCEDLGTVCTTEFVTYNLFVKGDTLTEYFTIRIANNDTIDHREIEYFPESDTNGRIYIILSDGYRAELEGKKEYFNFIGKIEGKIVINEIYIFGGGECHIYKESGKNEITLEQ